MALPVIAIIAQALSAASSLSNNAGAKKLGSISSAMSFADKLKTSTEGKK